MAEMEPAHQIYLLGAAELRKAWAPQPEAPMLRTAAPHALVFEICKHCRACRECAFEALDSTNLQTTVWMSSDFSSLRDVSNINDSTASPSLTQHISHLKGPILPAVQQSLNTTHGLSLRQINLWKAADRLFKCSSTIFEFENVRK